MAGRTLHEDPGNLYPVYNIISHEDFRNENLIIQNDIALLEIVEEFVFGSNINLVEMFNSGEKVEKGMIGVCSGWGFDRTGKLSSHLKVVNVPIIDNEKCFDIFFPFNNFGIFVDEICAGYFNFIGPNFYDSGGPLTINNRLAGVISWTLKVKAPAVFSSVSYHRDWINRHAKLE